MSISDKDLENFKLRFDLDSKNKAFAASLSNVGINASTLNNEVFKRHKFQFSDITNKGKITNQKQSGRCWMFAALNVARVETIKKLNIESIELSQNYTLFCDKLEKANFFLDNIIETVNEEQNSKNNPSLIRSSDARWRSMGYV